MFLGLVSGTFFSSRCMPKLKFAIYYRAASLPSQASSVHIDVCSGGCEIIDEALFKHRVNNRWNTLSTSTNL